MSDKERGFDRLLRLGFSSLARETVFAPLPEIDTLVGIVDASEYFGFPIVNIALVLASGAERWSRFIKMLADGTYAMGGNTSSKYFGFGCLSSSSASNGSSHSAPSGTMMTLWGARL